MTLSMIVPEYVPQINPAQRVHYSVRIVSSLLHCIPSYSTSLLRAVTHFGEIITSIADVWQVVTAGAPLVRIGTWHHKRSPFGKMTPPKLPGVVVCRAGGKQGNPARRQVMPWQLWLLACPFCPLRGD